MPFTTIQIVKKHLTDYRLGSQRIESEPLIMPASGYSHLQYGNIQEGSVKVKAKELNSPIREDIVFDSNDQAALAHAEIIPDSVVAANNSSLGRIYVENIDYTVDYDQGIIIRIDGGSIAPSAEISVWYQNYRLYTSGIDYSIDYVGGKISRITSGSIEAGQMVFVDYFAQYGNITDEAISNAIVEASDKVLAIIDPVYEDSTDQSLVTAETYLALAVICRINGIESAGRPDKTTSNFRGDFWLKLSSSYSMEGLTLLQNYARRANPLSSPKLTKIGGM